MKWFEISTPLTMFNNYQQFAVGSMVKLGPLFVGSDNLMAVAGLGKPFGADVYMGLTLPIYKGKKRDSDKDGVSNARMSARRCPACGNSRVAPTPMPTACRTRKTSAPSKPARKNSAAAPTGQ
jgi:hypothetical protein